MSALIESGGRFRWRLKDFEDLFHPKSDVKHCPLCKISFETHGLYKQHLKSPEHAENLTAHSSVSPVVTKGRKMLKSQDWTVSKMIFSEVAVQTTCAGPEALQFSSLSIKKVKRSRKPKKQEQKDFNSTVEKHDDLFRWDYCQVHKKKTRFKSHKKRADHKVIEALITGGLRKATLTIQDFIDLFNPHEDVTVCPLCHEDMETNNGYKEHLKSLHHLVFLTIHAAGAHPENIQISEPKIVEVEQPEMPLFLNNTLDISLD